MTIARSSRRTLGIALLLIGVLVLIVGGAYMVRSQAQGAALREELRSAEPVAAVSTATPEQAALALPRATVTPRAVPAKTATAAPVATRSATRATASARPAATSTATAVTVPTVPAGLVTTGREPVRLVFADLKIDTTVIPMGWQVVDTKNGPVSEWVIPRNEAGHHINSALLGEPGNLVISGHNNIYGQVFKPLSLAWDNDTRQKVDDFTDQSALLNDRRIELYDAAGERYDYVVREFYRLKDTGVSQAQRVANGRFILPTEDERLTIVTCWPPTNNTHRLILIAEPAP